MTTVPADWPVQPVSPDTPGAKTDGVCGLSWDDTKVTSLTPVPSGRCPFESFHTDIGAQVNANLETISVHIKDGFVPASDIRGKIIIEFEASFPQQVQDVVHVAEIVSANIFQNSIVRLESHTPEWKP